MWKIIGIDLGTTNSAVAYLMGGKSEIIANAEGKRTTPSIVYIKGDELLVGDLAKRKAILEPKNVVYEVKRFIGRKFSEVKEEIKTVPFEVKEGKDGGCIIVIDSKEYKPEQISAFILQKIKQDAEKFLGEPVTQAVITVPAYFNDSQRNATKVAGEIAGLKVERIINEPTAAALNYGEGKNKDEKICVFDLGWGTFDVTIMEIGAEGSYQVLSTSGDTHLWGADWDARIINFIIDEFKAKEGIDLKGNAMAMQRIKDEAENAKKQLSSTERVDITIPFITTGEDGTPRNLDVVLTKAKFEEITKDLFERTKQPVLDALKDSKLSKWDINDIILVGGSTRMPQVKKIVQDIFGKEPKATVNPDEAVAAGAAIQGGIIQGDVTDILLMDVTPLSLAVEVEGWLAHVMIERNTTIPAKKSNIYTTAGDNQNAVTVHVVQGERQFAKDNKSLGMFNLEGIPNMRRWEPKIEVTFDIDANGILSVSAKEQSTGKEQKVTIQGATGISDEEIAKAKEEAEKFAEEDKKKRELVEAKNRLEQVIYQMENMKNDNKDKIPEDEMTKIDELLKEANELKAKEDITKEELDKEIEKFSKEFETLMGKYAAANNSANPNSADVIEDESNKDDAPEAEVIDADGDKK
jgi:molecular chaperone DnaK